MIAGPDRTHVGPDRRDDARTLVSEQNRTIHGTRAATDQIGVADPGGDDPHQDLPGTGLVDLDRLDRELRRRIARQHRRCVHQETRSSRK